MELGSRRFGGKGVAACCRASVRHFAPARPGSEGCLRAQCRHGGSRLRCHSGLPSTPALTPPLRRSPTSLNFPHGHPGHLKPTCPPRRGGRGSVILLSSIRHSPAFSRPLEPSKLRSLGHSASLIARGVFSRRVVKGKKLWAQCEARRVVQRDQ